MPPKLNPLLQRAHRAFASKTNTVLAQLLIMLLVAMIFLIEIASQAMTRIY